MVAGEIADPTRSRMLCCLMDVRARASAKLAFCSDALIE